MHTFFINTSKKSLNGYEVLFDIHYENKALVSMDCPMSDWYDKEKGYVACAKQMSDMIDGYVELNNAYNLIIYIDLSDNKVYSSIPRDAFHDKDREECCRAMHILFTHVISESIVEELVNSGRRPQDVLVMFGEEKKFTNFKVATNDPAKLAVMKHLFGFIGLPDTETVEKLAKEVDLCDENDKVGCFKGKIESNLGSELVPGIRGRYTDALELWYDEVINDADISMADSLLFDRISGINRTEADRTGVETVSCPYDCYACRVNKSALALSQLNIALYLLRCVETGSIYDKSMGDDDKQLLPFHGYTADEIAPVLKDKEYLYSEKVQEIETLVNSYSELKLAPKLSAFDHGKFGLDEYGDVSVSMVVDDVDSSEKEEYSDEDSAEEETKDTETVLIEGKTKKVKVVKKTGRTLFSKEEFKPFDYNFDYNSDKMLKKNLTPEQYVDQASKLRRHHLDYLKKLKIHISEALSSYAGKSKENKPALLQVGGYRYAAHGEENKVLESVESVADKAYDTILKQYMEFCAGRSVAISDIEEQCNWFVSRVHQIRESIKRIKFVAIGLLAAIFVLYLPYFIIQSDVIFNLNDPTSFAIAVCSFGIPVGILYVVFTMLTAMRKKSYIKAWNEFKSKSDAALAENKVAVEKYDKMLATVIPALRWVYEYKLDVDYCVECCNVADAKIEHHRRKLRNRIQSIENILGDLEYRDYDEEEIRYEKKKVADLIDYNVPFCSGKKNKAFYSVIESTLYINKR